MFSAPKAGDRRQPGELGVRHARGQRQGSDRQPGDRVRAQCASAVAGQVAREGERPVHEAGPPRRFERRLVRPERRRLTRSPAPRAAKPRNPATAGRRRGRWLTHRWAPIETNRALTRPPPRPACTQLGANTRPPPLPVHHLVGTRPDARAARRRAPNHRRIRRGCCRRPIGSPTGQPAAGVAGAPHGPRRHLGPPMTLFQAPALSSRTDGRHSGDGRHHPRRMSLDVQPDEPDRTDRTEPLGEH